MSDNSENDTCSPFGRFFQSGFGRGLGRGDNSKSDSEDRWDRGGFGGGRGRNRGSYGRKTSLDDTKSDNDSEDRWNPEGNTRGGSSLGRGRNRGGFGRGFGSDTTSDNDSEDRWDPEGNTRRGRGRNRGRFGRGFGTKNSDPGWLNEGNSDNENRRDREGRARRGGFGGGGGRSRGSYGGKTSNPGWLDDGDSNDKNRGRKIRWLDEVKEDRPRDQKDEILRGGGFINDDEDRKSGGGCYKCGAHDHMAKNCAGHSKGCFKCGEEGHISRECPQSNDERRRCYKCGQKGHFAKECTSKESSRMFGGERNDGRKNEKKATECLKCGEEGHFSRECPKATQKENRVPAYIPPEPSQEEKDIFTSMEKGINFDKYDQIPVECTGRGGSSAERIDSFSQAALHDTLLDNIDKAGYDKPTPIQKFAINHILNGRDIMGCAQTGSGKTAAFLLPVITKMIENSIEGSCYSGIQEPQAVIIGPTRELVVQIYNEARKFSHSTVVRSVVLYGGTSVSHQLREVEKGAHIVVATPGRLCDFIKRGKIGLKKMKFLILDEADRMLDMGFENYVRKLVEQLGAPPKTDRQTLMFSATFPAEIQKLAKDFLDDYIFITMGVVGAANTDIEQTFHETTQFDKRDTLLSILLESQDDKILVFVETKKNADFLASFLCQNEFPTTSIHGDRLQQEREQALNDFKTGKKPILIATSVAARGLDIPGVKHVINYDLPGHGVEEYVHRIGRTGCCGNLGKATSFFDPDTDKEIARPLVTVLQNAHQEIPPWLEDAAKNCFENTRLGNQDIRKGRRYYGGGDSGKHIKDYSPVKSNVEDFPGHIGGTTEEYLWEY